MRLILGILMTAVLIAMVTYMVSGDRTVEQQPSPHAIDQGG
ncbi:hypothetical protein [Rhizobium nepotum]|jgi:hypothetical protein